MRIEKGMHGQWKVYVEGRVEHIGVVVKLIELVGGGYRGYGAGWNASKEHYPTKEAAGYQLEKDWNAKQNH